jgi:hypothetical protein
VRAHALGDLEVCVIGHFVSGGLLADPNAASATAAAIAARDSTRGEQRISGFLGDVT